MTLAPDVGGDWKRLAHHRFRGVLPGRRIWKDIVDTKSTCHFTLHSSLEVWLRGRNL
ncbi:hypothetical protein NY08_282 [Rhodococcus sp. B7740]|nr:hypothetical protein NY08_282 [Rhodococcus sp. B7740]